MGCGQVVVELLDKGASVEGKNEGGRTALWMACLLGRTQVLTDTQSTTDESLHN